MSNKTDNQTSSPDLSKLTLDQLIDEELRYSALTDQAEKQRKAIKGEILRQLTATGFQVGQSFVRGDGVSVNVQVKAGQEKIDRQVLILKGVDEDIVKAATTRSKDSAPFVVVRLPRQRKEDFVIGTVPADGTDSKHQYRQ